MNRTRRLLPLLLALCTFGTHADELRIPIGSQGRIEASRLPPHGMSMERVRAGWGEPELAHDPVGQPPITRWDYHDFTVYFEYRHVVRAVVLQRRRDPQTTLPGNP